MCNLVSDQIELRTKRSIRDLSRACFLFRSWHNDRSILFDRSCFFFFLFFSNRVRGTGRNRNSVCWKSALDWGLICQSDERGRDFNPLNARGWKCHTFFCRNKFLMYVHRLTIQLEIERKKFLKYVFKIRLWSIDFVLSSTFSSDEWN